MYKNDGTANNNFLTTGLKNKRTFSDEYFDDLAKAYREELRELYDSGCSKPTPLPSASEHISSFSYKGHIQIDDPTFCYFCNENMIIGMEKAGVDHEALLDTYIRAINVITEGRPDDLIMSLHMCRGNYKVSVSCIIEAL